MRTPSGDLIPLRSLNRRIGDGLVRRGINPAADRSGGDAIPS